MDKVLINMKCSCGAVFSIDMPAQHYSNYNARDLALAWNSAHSGHHNVTRMTVRGGRSRSRRERKTH